MSVPRLTAVVWSTGDVLTDPCLPAAIYLKAPPPGTVVSGHDKPALFQGWHKATLFLTVLQGGEQLDASRI